MTGNEVCVCKHELKWHNPCSLCDCAKFRRAKKEAAKK